MHFIKALPINPNKAVSEIQLPDYYGYGALLNFSLACKTFLDPGLDIHWKSLNNIVPIMRLLPLDAWTNDVYHIDDQGDSFSRIHIVRPLVPSDFERVLYYSGRVQRIGMMGIEHEHYVLAQIHEAARYHQYRIAAHDAYASLLQYRPTMHLFPNLRELRWVSAHLDAIQLAPLFSGPSLTTISLALDSKTNADELSTETIAAIATAIWSLSGMCPNLHHFEMNAVGGCNLPPSPLNETLCDLILDHPQLATFMLYTQRLTMDQIRHFSQSSYLRSCSLALMDHEVISALAGSMEFPPFRTLNTLHISVPDMPCFVEFIQLISPCNLGAIEIWPLQAPTAYGIADCFRTLSTCCSHNTLRVLRLTNRFDGDESPLREEWEITGGMMEPLLPFSNLIVLLIDCAPTLSALDNDAIARMARAWPKLKTFVLPSANPPIATFQGLLSLSRHCPELSVLELPLDISQNDLDEEELSTLVPNEYLQQVDLRNSTMGSSTMIVDNIHSLFPEVDLFEWNGYLTLTRNVMDDGTLLDIHVYKIRLNDILKSRWLERDPVLKAKMDNLFKTDPYTRNPFNPWVNE